MQRRVISIKYIVFKVPEAPKRPVPGEKVPVSVPKRGEPPAAGNLFL